MRSPRPTPSTWHRLEALESIPQTIANTLPDVRNFARYSRFGQNLNFQETFPAKRALIVTENVYKHTFFVRRLEGLRSARSDSMECRSRRMLSSPRCIVVLMARATRVDFPGAWYHVFNRGTERRAIFRSTGCCEKFIEFPIPHMRK